MPAFRWRGTELHSANCLGTVVLPILRIRFLWEGNVAIKFTEFFNRRPGMTSAAFLEHWQQNHTGVVSAIKGLRRYIQNPAAGLIDGVPNPYDGMVEVWFDDLAAIERLRKSDYWDTIVEDELRFVDRPRLQLFLSEEPVPKPPEVGFKCVYLLCQLPDQSREAFQERATAMTLPSGVPGLLGQQMMLPLEPHGGAEPCADAVEIWRFESLAALEAGMKSETIVNACCERDSWAKARAPLTTAERFIR